MKLKEAFGLEEDPVYEWNGGWKVGFCELGDRQRRGRVDRAGESIV